MFSHSTNTASLFSVLIAAFIFLLFAAGGTWAAQPQENTDLGKDALKNNTTGNNNTASGVDALRQNTTGNYNTASGYAALSRNTTGSVNTASGILALISNTTGNNNTASGILAPPLVPQPFNDDSLRK
jgi:hypothetical protein